MLTVEGFASPFSEDCTVLALAQASTDMQGSNVLLDDLSRKWRGLPDFSVIRFTFASTRFKFLDSVYIAEHNLNGVSTFNADGTILNQTDSWQVWASTDPGLDVFQIPASTQLATGLTGSPFTQYHPPSVSVAAYSSAAGSNSTGRWRFANPSPAFITTLPTGQIFRVYYTTTGSGTLTVTARLKEAGTLRATLSFPAPAVPASTLAEQAVLWSGASLTGAIPELELDVVATGTAAIQWHVIRWEVEMSNSATFHQSGAQVPPLAPTYRETDHASLSAQYRFPAALETRRLFIRLNRAGTNTSTAGAAADVGRIDGGLSLNFKMTGNSFEPEPRDDSVPVVMRDGFVRWHAREIYTHVSVRTPPELINKALAEKMGLALYAGVRKGLYWMFDSDDPLKAPYTWFFGRLDEMPKFGNVQRFFTSGFSVRQIR